MHTRRIPLKEIAQIVGTQNVLTGAEECHCYSFDASKLQGNPACVVFPKNGKEIAQLLQLANRERFSVFPRGAGTGMVGGSVPGPCGMVLALTRLNRIIEVDPDNMLAVVEPGVITGDLQKTVLQHGLFYPPDPASLQFSTLGGNVAMCAGGPRAVKYGVTRDYVLGLQVVLPTGSLIETGTRTLKGVVGYDLTRLLVGSEGTLGIFTQIVLRLVPAPQGVRTLVAYFHELDHAGLTVQNIIRERIIPSTLELMDRSAVQVVENHLHLGLPAHAEALLLIEVDGRECILDDDMAHMERICNRCGAFGIQLARTPPDREKLWQARRSISPALGQIKPGKINEDVTVPPNRIPSLIRSVRSLADKYRLIIVSFGHAGDGNIHVNIMVDRRDEDELRRAESAVEDLFRKVLELGGTLSGEHGVGITKSPFFRWEIGPGSFETMWKIKQALDPLNILNPGKMFLSDRAFFQSKK